MSIKDELIDSVAEKTDPADAWAMLQSMIQSGDQSQILLLTNKLHSMQLKEGGDVETYLRNAGELRNKLATIGEKIPKTMKINIVMNGFPRTFEGLIMTINTLSTLPSLIK